MKYFDAVFERSFSLCTIQNIKFSQVDRAVELNVVGGDACG